MTGTTLDEIELAPPADSCQGPAQRQAPASAADAVTVLSLVPVCGTACIEQIDEDLLTLRIGGERVTARRDPSVHPVVLRGAHARGERVLAEHRVDEGWVVVGALRTRPAPGIDVAEEYTIEAERVHIRGGSEVSLTARAASIVLRAMGEVETYAERILSRAEGLHKLVGRMLRLN